MAKKVYAVRKGYGVGIYYSWDECKKMIDGFSGAEYRGFNTEQEAEAYIRGEQTGVYNGKQVEIPVITSDTAVNLYTDGSYKDGSVAFGVVIQGAKIYRQFYGVINCPEYERIANIAGELFGVLVGLELARDMGFYNVNIIYDYKGVEDYYKGTWKSQGKLQNIYVALLKQFHATFNMNYRFIKVTGHSGIKGNVDADRMAARGRNLMQYVDCESVLRGLITVRDVPVYR